MPKYKVSYELDYVHQVAFAVDAPDPAQAKCVVERGVELGTIWDDGEQHQLVEDIFDEVDSGRAFELKVEQATEELAPSPVVLAERRRTAALKFLCRVAELKVWGEPDPDNDGRPFEPIDGLEDSHGCLMELIADARELLAPDSRATPALNDAATADSGQPETSATSYVDSQGVASNMTFSESLELVHALATLQQMDKGDADVGDDNLRSQIEWQGAALDMLEDLVTNHHEEIDARYPRPTGAGAWPATSWRAERSMDPAVPSNAIKICLDLATTGVLDAREAGRNVYLAEQVDRQYCALDLCRDFMGMYGSRLDGELRTIHVAPDPSP